MQSISPVWADSAAKSAMALVVADLSSDKYVDSPTREVALSIAARLENIIANLQGIDDAIVARGVAKHLGEMLMERGAQLADANMISKMRVELERRIGEDLREIVSRGNPSFRPGMDYRTPEGISKNQSSEWQRLAAIPLDVFSQYLDECIAGEIEITTRGALSLWYRLFAIQSQGGDGEILSSAPPAPESFEQDYGNSIYYTCPNCGAENLLSDMIKREEDE